LASLDVIRIDNDASGPQDQHRQQSNDQQTSSHVRPFPKIVQPQAKSSVLKIVPATVKPKFAAFRVNPHCVAARDLSPY
jgi:hypothetical protein